MSIMDFIFWFLLWSNALFAQGYHYDLATGQIVSPGGQPVVVGNWQKPSR